MNLAATPCSLQHSIEIKDCGGTPGGVRPLPQPGGHSTNPKLQLSHHKLFKHTPQTLAEKLV